MILQPKCHEGGGSLLYKSGGLNTKGGSVDVHVFVAQFCLFFFLFGSIYNEQNQSHFGMIFNIQRLKQLFFKESESESTQIESKHSQLLIFISVMKNCDNSLISI